MGCPWRTRRVAAGLCAVLLAMAAGAQETGWGRHKRMFAVPALAKVVIDGQLDEWDMSGAIEIYVMAATREVQSARFAILYDAEALYLGAEVRDPSPLMNRHAPEAEGNLGWDADACQFRMVLDPRQGYPATDTTWKREANDQLVHLLLWHYTDRKEPNLQMHRSMRYEELPGSEKFGVIPKGKFAAAYRLADDAKGYTFEYRIPWATLGTANPPKAGDVVSATVQFNWGRADGLKTAGLSAWGYDLMAFAGFPYQNAGCWGKLIFAKEGRLARGLVEEGLPPEKPTPLAFDYDVPEEGEVTVALINGQNEVVRTLAAQTPCLGGHVVQKWDGLDELGRVLPAGAYTWKGLVHKPLKLQPVVSLHNSGRPPWKTDDNTGGWGGDHGEPQAACAVADGLVLAWNSAEAGWGIIRTDAEGRKRWGILHTAAYLASDGKRIFAAEGAQVVGYDLRDGRPLPYEGGAASLPPPEKREGPPPAVTGLAYHDGKLFVAFASADLIGIYDAAKGALLRCWAVPAPGALAVRADGALVAVCAGKLVAIQEGRVTRLAADHLDEPQGVAVDAAGTIYVANQGRLQNVSVFSAAGTYLRSIGREGGRPRMGRFDPTGMLRPLALAIDVRGRLWVMECIDAPKRVSVWDTKTGELAMEFFGGAHYSAHIWMDPEHPDEVYCDGVMWKVDLDKRTAAPYSTIWRPASPDSPGMLTTHGGGLEPFTAANGRQYAFATDQHHSRVLFQRAGDVFKPLLAFVWTTGNPAVKAKYPNDPRGATLVWVDRNDDQIMQADEIGPQVGPSWYRGFSCADRDLNLWHPSGQVFRPIRFEADGRPVYDFSKPDKNPIPGGPAQADPQDGSLYVLNDQSRPSTSISFGRYQADGKLLWGYSGLVPWPQALSLPPQRPGKLWGATVELGVAGDFTGFATYFGCHHLYTRDGLCVAMIFRDTRLGGELGPDFIACENYNGQIVKPKGMDRYFALGGDQDGRITEVLGLDTVKRLAGGEYTIREADVKRVADAQAEYQARLAKSQKLTIVRGRRALDTAQPVGKQVSALQAFQARAAYDEKNLYVGFDVTSRSDLANGFPDPQLLFKGGNLLDIQIAADPQADPKRKTPAPGDVRILVTQQNGKPCAVVFRPKVKGFQGHPIVLKSPTGQEPFDAIEATDRIGLEYHKDLNSPIFKATVTIPMDLIGLTPQPGTKVRMDLGYVFGNTTGTKALARAYWTNNGFSANVLDDVPNESRLTPAEWGEAEVE